MNLFITFDLKYTANNELYGYIDIFKADDELVQEDQVDQD